MKRENKKRGVNRFLAVLTAWMMLFTLVPATASAEEETTTATAPTEDGVYAVQGTMVKPTAKMEDKSMSDGAITHSIKLTVKDGEYTVTMNFKGLTITISGVSLHSYLKDLKYYKTGYTKNEDSNYPSGDLESVTVDSIQKYTDGTTLRDDYGTDYPDVVSFPLIDEAKEDGLVPLQVFVPVMDSITKGSGTQDVYLKLDWSKCEKTTDDDEAFSSEDVVEENPAAEKTETKTDSGQQDTKNAAQNDSQNTTNTVTVGQTTTSGGCIYTVTAVNGTEGEAAFTGVSDKKVKKVTVTDTVVVGGVTCKVTSIADNALKGCKKLKSVTIGKNVKAIGKSAFAGCRSLKKINVKSAQITKVGAKAFSGIYKKAVIKTPKKQLKAYKKLFKGKGQKKSVTIR